MNIKKVFIVVFLIATFTASAYAEVVFLRDGSIIDGTIISDGTKSITMRDKENKRRDIQRADIMRILYTELKMGKIYIQKRDGKGIVAYMVDEDRESYTFRMDLYKPEEFVLKRSDVLFIAEKNPSGLQVDGEVGTDRVPLKWLPPYDEVKKYNVYIKKNEKDKYELIDSTGSRSITLKKLTSNTTYFIIVTSVDADNYESAPSNELKIAMKNIPPDEPEITDSGDYRADERRIVWLPANDPDGKVEKYRIYGTVESRRELVSELKSTEYYLKKATLYSKVELIAVDDKGGESDSVLIPTYATTSFGFYPGVIFPMGKFGKMFGPGYGGLITFSECDIIIDDFEAGMSLGLYFMQGKDLIEERNIDYLKSVFIPLYFTAGYKIDITGSMRIKPLLYCGIAYIDAEYSDRNKTAAEGQDVHLKLINPVFNASLAAEYRLTYCLTMFAECGYGAIIQNDGLLNFASVNAGISYSF